MGGFKLILKKIPFFSCYYPLKWFEFVKNILREIILHRMKFITPKS